jgi:hypothetical protein
MRQGEKRGTPLSRFLSRIRIYDADSCWPWTGQTQDTGYGTMQWRGKLVGVHRIMAALAYGRIKRGQHVMHLCNTPICCNPAHLRVGTPAENSAMAAKDGLYTRGSAVHAAKLNERQVREILASPLPPSSTVLAKRYGVTRCTIYRIKHRQIWTHLKVLP